MIRRHVDARPPRILEVGCGGGIVAEALAAAGCRVVGLDPSRPSIAAARTHARRGSFPQPPRYVHGAGERLPFAAASFDAVVAADSIEHVEDPSAVLREARRVLRPKGVFCFETPNRTWFTRLGFIWCAELLRLAPRRAHVAERLFTPPELAARCIEAGLLVEEMRGVALREPAWSALLGYLTDRQLGGFELGDDDRFLFVGHARPIATAAGVE